MTENKNETDQSNGNGRVNGQPEHQEPNQKPEPIPDADEKVELTNTMALNEDFFVALLGKDLFKQLNEEFFSQLKKDKDPNLHEGSKDKDPNLHPRFIDIATLLLLKTLDKGQFNLTEGYDMYKLERDGLPAMIKAELKSKKKMDEFIKQLKIDLSGKVGDSGTVDD